MNKERFNEIIDLLIVNLANGICATLNRLCLNKLITSAEDRQFITMLNITFHQMKIDGETYSFNGQKSLTGAYRFPNDAERIIFLDNLKESYETINS